MKYPELKGTSYQVKEGLRIRTARIKQLASLKEDLVLADGLKKPELQKKLRGMVEPQIAAIEKLLESDDAKAFLASSHWSF